MNLIRLLLLVNSWISISSFVKAKPAIPLYKVNIYLVCIKTHVMEFGLFGPVKFTTSVTLKENESKWNPTQEFQVDLMNVDGSNIQTQVLVNLCGCSHIFSVKAELDSGQYGEFSTTMSCISNICGYQYDHQVKIQVDTYDDRENYSHRAKLVDSYVISVLGVSSLFGF